MVIELDSRLHDQRDRAGPRGAEAERRERFAMGVDRHADRGGSRHRQRAELLGRTAGCGHLGANHVDGSLPASGLPGTLGGAAEPGRALGDDAIGEGRRVIGAAHRAVQVDFPKSRGHVALDELLGVCHGDAGWLRAPGVGAEMVAAEQHPFGRQDCMGGDLRHVRPERGRSHAGVAAELVDLVRGRLDEHPLSVPLSLAQCGLDDERVRGTDGVDPLAAAGLVPLEELLEGLHEAGSTGASGCSDRSSAPPSASRMPAIL